MIRGDKVIDYMQNRVILLDSTKFPPTLGELEWHFVASPQTWKQWEEVKVKELETINDNWYDRMTISAGAIDYEHMSDK